MISLEFQKSCSSIINVHSIGPLDYWSDGSFDARQRLRRCAFISARIRSKTLFSTHRTHGFTLQNRCVRKRCHHSIGICSTDASAMCTILIQRSFVTYFSTLKRHLTPKEKSSSKNLHRSIESCRALFKAFQLRLAHASKLPSCTGFSIPYTSA